MSENQGMGGCKEASILEGRLNVTRNLTSSIIRDLLNLEKRLEPVLEPATPETEAPTQAQELSAPLIKVIAEDDAEKKEALAIIDRISARLIV